MVPDLFGAAKHFRTKNAEGELAYKYKDIQSKYVGNLDKLKLYRKRLEAFDMLIFQEPPRGSNSFTRLTMVLRELYNIMFIAFHMNPIGGHLNAYRTLHRLRLRYYWPGMYTYVKRMCHSCPGCALSNLTRGKSSELIYNFPIEAPFLVIHFDAYAAGKFSGFEGYHVYLIVCCGMCSFACMEPITNPSATTFASAIMKILLCYGFCHTAVLDKDTKFYGVCRKALDLL